MPVSIEPNTTENVEVKNFGGKLVSQRGRVKQLLASSMFVWIVIFVVLIDQTTRLSDKRVPTSYSSKLANFFNSDMHPDVLLIGSSVALSSAYESDKAIGVISEKVRKSEYYGAEQLTRSIESTTGKKLSIVNLACFGAATNYAWMCTTKLVEFDKIPKVIVYETVSRDLFDASIPRSFESEYYRTMAFAHPKKVSKTPQIFQQAYDYLMGSHVVTLAQNLLSEPETLRNPERFRFEFDSTLGALIYIYQKRVEVLAGLTESAMKLTDRQSSFGALQNQIDNKKKNPFAKLSAQPIGVFDVDPTPQLGRFEDEKVYFVKLLQVCKKNNIRLIVVNMPVTESYERLVPTQLRSRWPSEIENAAKQYGFEVLDCNAKHDFTGDDFIDMAHLNGKGSLKLNDILSKEIARRGLVSDL